MNNKTKIISIRIAILIITLAIMLLGCSSTSNNLNSKNISINTINNTESVNDIQYNEESEQNEIEETIDLAQENELLEIASYTAIEVDGGDLSGHREANVVVDIGFGDREYLAFTNDYGQLFRVTAKEIILQDDDNEPVLSTGRYFRDEAKVPGVESPTLDEGHVIADSLGGVSNAYNITPQNSTLNRHGDQAYLEKVIRVAGGCTDFEAIITYPNTTTQIPSHYSFTYTLKGNVIHDEFDNTNPDEVNANLDETESKEVQISTDMVEIDNPINIIELDKRAEYIILKNVSDDPVNLKDWRILSIRGGQTFFFPEFILQPDTTVKVGDSDKNPDVDYHWLDGRGTWNNSESDPAELYNTQGDLVDRYDD